MRRPLLRAPIRYQISSCQRWQHLRQRPISLQTMSRPRRPAALPLQDGVSASCAVVHGGPWPSALDFLAARLPVLHRDEWAKRFARGEVLDAQGAALAASAPCREGQRLFYYRRLEAEPAAPEAPRVLHQDDTLVVVDKPHFMPVTPGGRFIQRSLLVQLKRMLGLPDLAPLHRIDRETAGLVMFAVRPDVRAAYQALFRDRRIDKLYEAVAPDVPALATPRTHASRLQEDAERFFLSREVPGEPNSCSHIQRVALVGSAGHALYALRPITGQRHQLRLHMLAMGAPILGDTFYPVVLHGPHSEADDLMRPLQLLARELAFEDPLTGQRRVFRSQRQLVGASGAWPADADRAA